MDETQGFCCTEWPIWPMWPIPMWPMWPIWIIQSIFNQQDAVEKYLIELQVLALDIASKLWLDMNPSEPAREGMPEVKPSWLHYVNIRESENKSRLADILKTLIEINSQL